MTFKLITTKRFINTTVKTFGTFGQSNGYFGPFKWSNGLLVVSKTVIRTDSRKSYLID